MGAFFRIRPIIGLVAVVSIAAWFAAPAAAASTPFVDVHSTGPLSDIYIGNDLSCQVRGGGFSSTEFFPNASGPGDCGTFLFTGTDTAGEALFGPDFANHAGGTNTTGHFSVTETPFTPVSQTMTGAGTAASPYEVTTVVKTSETNQNDAVIQLQVTEVDSYIVGDDFYRTDITVQNTGNTDEDAVADLYHAGDCQRADPITGSEHPNRRRIRLHPHARRTCSATRRPRRRCSHPSPQGDHWEQRAADDLVGSRLDVAR